MEKRNIAGFSIAALVLGICSVILGLIYWTVYAGLLLGLTGIAFAAMGRRKDRSGLALSGLIVAIIGVLLFVGWALFPVPLSYVIMPFFTAG